MAVLHVGHVPLIAGFPFFMVYGAGLPISRLSRHFTQYPIVIVQLGSLLYYRDLVELFLQIGKHLILFFLFRNDFFRIGFLIYFFLKVLFDNNPIFQDQIMLQILLVLCLFLL